MTASIAKSPIPQIRRRPARRALDALERHRDSIGYTVWLERFSNELHSNATSAGTYKTGSRYVGVHGHSMRLEGLDPTNSNALSRAIVVHGAASRSRIPACPKSWRGLVPGNFFTYSIDLTLTGAEY
jgi:hypothetical protein